MFGTTKPVWPREEQLYLDVAVQVRHLAQEGDGGGAGGGNGSGSGNGSATLGGDGSVSDPEKARQRYGGYSDSRGGNGSGAVDWYAAPAPPRPVLSLSVHHSTGTGRKGEKARGGGQEAAEGPFLGDASIDVTRVLTGAVPILDQWLPLRVEGRSAEGGGRDFDKDFTYSGEVRVACEYEPSDPPPRPGDHCRFTRFCDPADLYPIPPSHAFRVDEVEGDEVVLSYTSPEGWLCTFRAHRYAIVCAERHKAALEACSQRIVELTERLAQSPAAGAVRDTVDRVPDEGLLYVGAEAAMRGAGLVGRWFQGGIGLAVEDIVSVTNLDGRHLPGPDGDGMGDLNEENRMGSDSDIDTGRNEEPLPGMPCCPITSQPMVSKL